MVVLIKSPRTSGYNLEGDSALWTYTDATENHLWKIISESMKALLARVACWSTSKATVTLTVSELNRGCP